MHDIFVKIEWLCYDDELIAFETADEAVAFAKAKSKEHWVNYCKVYIWGFLQWTFDFGEIIKSE